MKRASVLCLAPSTCCLLLTAYCLLPAAVHAQSSNSTYTFVQDLVSSGGGQIGGGNPMRAQTVLGLPAGGIASNASFSLRGGFGGNGGTVRQPASALITVTGTTDDPTATVTVNGITATRSVGTFTASNVPILEGPNTLTAVVTDTYGNSQSKDVTVYLDVPAEQKTYRFHVPVVGTINEASATVTVNGLSAPVSAGQYSVSVPLTSGVNTITAVATDIGGNTDTKTVRVFVPIPTSFPAMPTVGTSGYTLPEVTIANSVLTGGTKTAGTSIWINGQLVVALNNELTWNATLSLIEGDNPFTIVTKDSNGVASAAVTINIVKDALAPVVTFNPPAKSNLPTTVFTGEVDDSLTTVKINNIDAIRNGKAFEVSVPLTLGPNTLQLVATSRLDRVTTQSKSIIRGTIPTISALSPPDGTIVQAATATTIQITATDQESDPIQYQTLLDGAVLVDWNTSKSQPWTPTTAQTGTHTLTGKAKDDWGGSDEEAGEVYVVRPPIQHP